MTLEDVLGSNGRQNKLWKVELQKLADELAIDITVCHFPPKTSKWNKIEHRLFLYISKNWRGRPLVDMATVVNLIANTKTEIGLTVRCVEDRNVYPTKIKVTDEQLAQVDLEPETFHAEWNYYRVSFNFVNLILTCRHLFADKSSTSCHNFERSTVLHHQIKNADYFRFGGGKPSVKIRKLKFCLFCQINWIATC